MNPLIPELAAEHILEFPLPVDIDEVVEPVLMRSHPRGEVNS